MSQEDFFTELCFKIEKLIQEIEENENNDKNAFFNENHNLIIQKALKIYQSEKMQTLEEISLESNLSKERVRQIRKDCIDELFDKISFIKNFNDDLFQNYGVKGLQLIPFAGFSGCPVVCA